MGNLDMQDGWEQSQLDIRKMANFPVRCLLWRSPLIVWLS
jgi:hypothetical protein